jgi:hypothetical protein
MLRCRGFRQTCQYLFLTDTFQIPSLPHIPGLQRRWEERWSESINKNWCTYNISEKADEPTNEVDKVQLRKRQGDLARPSAQKWRFLDQASTVELQILLQCLPRPAHFAAFPWWIWWKQRVSGRILCKQNIWGIWLMKNDARFTFRANFQSLWLLIST